MDSIPRISVILPVYNGERYLHQAIDSILNQTCDDFELIIIDDASTDTTMEILDAYSDSRIVRLHNQEHLGITPSLNRGLEVSRCEHVARMDADDISLPDRLARQADYLDSHPEIGVLGSAVQVIDAGGNLREIWRYPEHHAMIRWLLCFNDSLAHPSVMMRRTVVSGSGGYHSDFSSAQDYDLWRRLNRITRFANLGEVLLYIRRHDESISSTQYTAQRENSFRVSQAMMMDILGTEIPPEIIRNLREDTFNNFSGIFRAAMLVSRLCRAYVSDRPLPEKEKRMIHRDAADRLIHLSRLGLGDVRTLAIIWLAFRLEPGAALRAGKKLYQRNMDKLLNPGRS